MGLKGRIISAILKLAPAKSKFGKEFQQLHDQKLAEAAALDAEYGRLTEEYHNGAINTAQYNYYSSHPQYLSWYYIAVRNAWRCWSLQSYLGNGPPKPRRGGDDEQDAGSVLQNVPSILFDLGRLKSSEAMIEAARQDHSRLSRDLRDKRSVFRPTRDSWREVGVESDSLINRAVTDHLGDGQGLALFGAQVPAVETSFLAEIANGPIVQLGPDEIETEGSSLEPYLPGKELDCIIVTERIASLGLDVSGVANANADIEKISELKDRLCDGGLMIMVLPVASRDETLAGLARVYGPERRAMLFSGLGLVEEYQAEGSETAPLNFGLNVYVLRRLES